MQNNATELELLPDEGLVNKAQKGSAEALAELLRRHRSGCMKLALSILRDRQDAEDEVQNAMWKAFEHIGQFQRDSKFSTWLTRIVVNQCLMRLRKARRARFLYIDDVRIGPEAAGMELKASASTAEEELKKTEVAALLHREIHRIPPLLRKVFLLRDIQQLPMPDVADQLGISVAAAKSRLLRARLELRSRMERHFGGLAWEDWSGYADRLGWLWGRAAR